MMAAVKEDPKSGGQGGSNPTAPGDSATVTV